MSKTRLDALVHLFYPQYSRAQIQSWIMQRKVTVNGKIIDKSGAQVDPESMIVLAVEEPKYVSRAGFKMEKALDFFNLSVQDYVIMDAGLSTGGFTDCLLQRGAQKIYGIDVGHGQVHEKIRTDSRVVVIERTNLREVRDLGEKVDLITLDLSFISVLKVMDAVCSLLKDNGKLITLIKPQFEARKEDVGRGGIIKDPRVHQEVIDRVTSGIIQRGFTLIGITESPIQGTMGNTEFLAYFNKSS